jgi:hypothetical protein
VLAFHRVSHLVSPEVPIITESRVEEEDIREEIERALDALSPESLGDRMLGHVLVTKNVRSQSELPRSRNAGMPKLVWSGQFR